MEELHPRKVLPPIGAGDVPGRDLMRWLRDRLCEAHFLRWGQIEDHELRGLIPDNQWGSVGFAVRQMKDGHLVFTVAISPSLCDVPYLKVSAEESRPHQWHAYRAQRELREFFRQHGFRVYRMLWFAWDNDLLEFNVETNFPEVLGSPVSQERLDRRKVRG